MPRPVMERPRALEVGASLLAIVGVINIGRVAYGVVVNLGQDDWDSGARAVFLVLNAIVLVFGLFIVVLADQVRRGRMWAWILSLVVLPFAFLYGVLLLLITGMNGGVPFAGAGAVVACLAALLTLTVPRSVRDYVLRRRVAAGRPFA